MAPPRFRRQSTETAGRFRIFDVLRHRIASDDSEVVRDAFTFECPDWVSVVPVTEDGRFVLVRQYRHGIDAETLEVPGGLIDPGESPEEAARRELKEETGHAGETLESLGSSHPNPVLQGNRHHMFLARKARSLGPPEFDAGEYCEVVVLPEADLRKAINDGEVTHALVLLSLARAFEKLGAEGAISRALDPVETAKPADAAGLVQALRELADLEDLQAKKVIDLARRIRPGLTQEDIKNPHDFPDLDDPDWHFEDGQLAGIQGVITLLRALRDRGPKGSGRA